MSQSNSESEPFHFPRISSNELKKEILNLNNKKATKQGDIPVNLLKGSIDTYLPVVTEITNSSFEQNEFPNELKLADIIPIFKKKDPLNKENYRPVSILLMMIMWLGRVGETNTTYHVTPNTYVSLVKLQYMSIYGQILRQFLPTGLCMKTFTFFQKNFF